MSVEIEDSQEAPYTECVTLEHVSTICKRQPYTCKQEITIIIRISKETCRFSLAVFFLLEGNLKNPRTRQYRTFPNSESGIFGRIFPCKMYHFEV